VLRAEAAGSDAGGAAGWAAEYRDSLRAVVAEHGCVLVRGLGLRDADGVGAVFHGLADGLMTEREAFASRRTYADGVYSASKWPANQQMCMHHELSYLIEFPGLLLFACLTAATEGGATAVSDSATVLQALPAELVGRFEREGWVLIRNYNEDIGASVADAFGTDDRGAVESYCRATAIEFEWQPDGGLRTRQHRSAVVRHPVTGQRWRAVLFTWKCLCLGADRSFDKPYSPRPRHFLSVNDQGQPIIRESPRLAFRLLLGPVDEAGRPTQRIARLAGGHDHHAVVCGVLEVKQP
jgi:hypothetical protein